MRIALIGCMIITLTLAILLQDNPIAGLRHDDIAVREAAEAALVARGESTVPALRKLAAAERDAEVRARLLRVVDRLTSLQWETDLSAALAKAAREGKRVLVLATPGQLGGAT